MSFFCRLKERLRRISPGLAEKIEDWDLDEAKWSRGEFPDYADAKDRSLTYVQWAGQRPQTKPEFSTWHTDKARKSLGELRQASLNFGNGPNWTRCAAEDIERIIAVVEEALRGAESASDGESNPAPDGTTIKPAA
jgi:hypothetical protein